VIFAACWLAGQAALVLSARTRPDSAFAFRMFPEASTIEVHLWREVDGRWIPAPLGEWSARDASGQLRHFSWRDRVRDPTLAALDSRVFASYGVDTQLARLDRALDDAAGHLPEDAETKRLRAEVLVSRNGREATTTVLESHARRSP
jgi:hypothetical protein